MRLRISLAILLLVMASPGLVAAQDVYDNGPINGTTDGWTINFGFVVSNSFAVSGATTATGVAFGAWLFPGDVLQSVEVSITSSEFGGTEYLDQVVNFAASGCTTNQYGFNVCTETSTNMTSISVGAGIYWLNLQNAVVNTGDPIYWDENSGPSRASQNAVGTIPSESFSIFGPCTEGQNSPGCGPPVPEPSSILLLISGVLGLGSFLRKRTPW